ncbi:MAG TPA: hypothetical protein EYN70_15460 [Planctomycetaceae bacterium]|nr:hypothetical protein [Planctomycetaceae bacterium]
MPIITPSAHQLRSEVPSKTPVTLLRDGSPKIKWEIDELPKKSLHVAPTQIFSSINATLICLLAWSWYPARRRDGELLAGMLTVYPITRFLLEMIRTDEPGRWGTGLTVAQWASILLLILAVFLWAYILCRPAKRCLPVQHA